MDELLDLGATTYGNKSTDLRRVQVTSISPPHPRAIYDGVTVGFNGMTFSGGGWKNASITLDMSPADALDLASELIKASDKHGEETQNRVRSLVKRLAKKQSPKV